jgi:hypothetical protein
MTNDLSAPLRLPVRRTQTGSGAQAGQFPMTNWSVLGLRDFRVWG